MAKAYASCIIEAPVEAVWEVARDFDALPVWLPMVSRSTIEDGLAADVVGCVRSFYIGEQNVRERLLMLDDARYAFAYNFETPAFPVGDYVATFELIPVTDGERTFAQWSASFEEAPEDKGKYETVIARDVFAAGLQALSAHLRGRTAPPGARRWQGFRPAKVFCSAVLRAPLETAWARIRDFSAMSQWHPGIADMTMLDGARPDKVSAVRDFRFGDGRLRERLTMLSDLTHGFRYTIEQSPMPWLDYHAGVRLYPVTEANTTFAVWTADWVAAPNEDLTLIPTVHQGVFQTAFDTLNERFFQA